MKRQKSYPSPIHHTEPPFRIISKHGDDSSLPKQTPLKNLEELAQELEFWTKLYHLAAAMAMVTMAMVARLQGPSQHTVLLTSNGTAVACGDNRTGQCMTVHHSTFG